MKIDFGKENIEIAKKDFISHVKGDGKRGPFYSGRKWKFDNNDSSLFKDAVWQGYLDASRTFYKINTTDRTAFDNLAENIRSFFVGSACFDHDGWCNSFILDINESNGYKCRYGQAQKVVNMAFKYLYCCNGIDKEMFAKCHMPLDQYTLAWLFSEGGKLYTNWSYFTKELYEDAQAEIRTALSKYVQKDILAAELVIWKTVPEYLCDLKDKYNVCIKRMDEGEQYEED